MDVYTRDDLKIMQAWTLDHKIGVTRTRLMEWNYRHGGDLDTVSPNIHVSFSGGKDSTVLLHIARKLYPNIKAVFADTGLEYPEIRDFVKSFDNVDWVRPKKTFRRVIEEYGYPLVSKEVAKTISYARKGSRWAQNRLLGLNAIGEVDNWKRRFIKWAYLVDAPFAISEKCCYWLKESVLDSHPGKPMIATMAADSQQRMSGYLHSGCNLFTGKKPRSTPMGFWTEQDVLMYIKAYNVPIAPIYGEIIEEGGKLRTTGAERTGCIFCAFGAHIKSKRKTRFELLKESHPKLYEYCMKPWDAGGLGMGEVLDYIGVRR